MEFPHACNQHSIRNLLSLLLQKPISAVSLIYTTYQNFEDILIACLFPVLEGGHSIAPKTTSANAASANP